MLEVDCVFEGETECDRCLVVPTVSETQCRNALLKLGYSLPN
ncbi:MAG: hypothetical protein RID09_24195 [Coleofasciculus sp. G1-WW12-02]